MEPLKNKLAQVMHSLQVKAAQNQNIWKNMKSQNTNYVSKQSKRWHNLWHKLNYITNSNYYYQIILSSFINIQIWLTFIAFKSAFNVKLIHLINTQKYSITEDIWTNIHL